MSTGPMPKLKNQVVDIGYIMERGRRITAAGYPKSRWLIFCETMLLKGFTLKVYEAPRTNSKYVTVMEQQRSFKVRFSDHCPIFHREANGDCDFFIGVTNLRVTNTEDTINAALQYFGRE